MQQAIWEHSFAPQSQDDEEELSGTSHPDHEDHHHDHGDKDKQSGIYHVDDDNDNDQWSWYRIPDTPSASNEFFWGQGHPFRERCWQKNILLLKKGKLNEYLRFNLF